MSKTPGTEEFKESVQDNYSTPPKKRTRIKSDLVENISAFEKPIKLEETPTEALQRGSLKPIVWFFIVYNVVTIAFIGYLAYLEVNYKLGIITDKVIIAVIAGITIQTSSIIIAAFKGLFK